MHLQNIQQVVEEIRSLITGRHLAKVFQLGPASLAIDFGLREGRYLFVSADPAEPRLYLIKRRVKDLEKQSLSRSQFAQTIVARLIGALVTEIKEDCSERIVRFRLETLVEQFTLVAQLTGRSANLFLLDSRDHISVAARSTKSTGQSPGDVYRSPAARSDAVPDEAVVAKGHFDSLSAALDSHYQELEREKSFQELANSLRSKLKKEIRQRDKLRLNLEQDLVTHGEPEEHKRLGDLLLANISTVQRHGPKILIKDFYSEGSPEIELDLDKDMTLQEAAAQHFARYTKAKRARAEITKRMKQVSSELKELAVKQATIEELINQQDREALSKLVKPETLPRSRGTKPRVKIPGVRVYRSSDNYEVLVGRAARDNDNLTFRIAGPNDLWLHSADYPGSHVIVRRENRKELPQRTIIEAAQLAAHFSQAGKDSKVVVHYTPRKFLSKPKGGAPGLVRMSTYKTILVEPKETLPRE